MDEEIVTLASFSSPLEADRVKQQLEKAGIRVFLSGETTGGLFAGMGLGQVQVMVAASSVSMAQDVLRSRDEETDRPDPGKPRRRQRKSPSGGKARHRHGEAPEEATQGALPRNDGNRGSPNRGNDQRTNVALTADDKAERAWRAALYGLITLPGLFHLYSACVLLLLLTSSEEVSDAGMRKVWAAMLIDCAVLLGIFAACAGLHAYR